MKIQGYEIGTEVKWNDEQAGGFRTGIVRARYYDPDVTEINGQSIEINVIGNSPTYEIEAADDADVLILNHTTVVRSRAIDER